MVPSNRRQARNSEAREVKRWGQEAGGGERKSAKKEWAGKWQQGGEQGEGGGGSRRASQERAARRRDCAEEEGTERQAVADGRHAKGGSSARARPKGDDGPKGGGRGIPEAKYHPKRGEWRGNSWERPEPPGRLIRRGRRKGQFTLEVSLHKERSSYGARSIESTGGWADAGGEPGTPREETRRDGRRTRTEDGGGRVKRGGGHGMGHKGAL